MANPILSKLANEESLSSSTPLTINGIIIKSLFLFAFLFAGVALQLELLMKNYSSLFGILIQVGLFGGAITALIICFTKKAMSFLTPLYSFLEGLALGGISILAEIKFPGIAINAISGTFAVFLVMLALYKAKLIKPTEKFKSILMISMFSIMGIYSLQIILGFFHLGLTPLFSGGLIGIGFSIFVITIASLNFILDFANIELAQNYMLDKNYEWYMAFGLMTTFVWLYIEILNLLSKLNSRN